MNREEQSKADALFAAIRDEIQSVEKAGKVKDERALATLGFEIGRILEENRADTFVVTPLAEGLQREFSNIMHFSSDSLAAMARFYRTYGEHEVLSTLIDAISWSKHRAILERCDTDRAQEFYIRMARKFEWSESVLIQKIEDFRPPQ
jgi:hypothetical protein